jgi:hypothetical protein
VQRWHRRAVSVQNVANGEPREAAGLGASSDGSSCASRLDRQTCSRLQRLGAGVAPVRQTGRDVGSCRTFAGTGRF